MYEYLSTPQIFFFGFSLFAPAPDGVFIARTIHRWGKMAVWDDRSIWHRHLSFPPDILGSLCLEEEY